MRQCYKAEAGEAWLQPAAAIDWPRLTSECASGKLLLAAAATAPHSAQTLGSVS